MLDDWNITHERGDLPPQVWEFLKTRGFFAMIIPKKYGGLEFSAYAHSCVLAKISSRSATASSTVAVPNSLGPAELLNHYGTEEQKNYYLPRLARGEEVPVLRAHRSARRLRRRLHPRHRHRVPRHVAGRARSSGCELNFSKRYITLAPVATVIGLAFRMFDPDQLLGGKTDIGITCALIPRHTPGITIGRRHFPLNVPFQNGPIQGQGRVRAARLHHRRSGDGRQRLAHAGRAALGRAAASRCLPTPPAAAKAAVWATGAYARIRKQFNTPVGRFEGVEAVIARMVGLTYTMDAARSVTAGAIDGGEKPSVPFRHAQVPRHRDGPAGRQRRHGRARRQGHLLGPKNYLGARLPGRAGRDHGRGREPPHAQPHHLRSGRDPLPSVRAARDDRGAQPRPRRAAWTSSTARSSAHIGFTISNAVRSFIMALTHARFTRAPVAGRDRALLPAHRALQRLVRLRGRRGDADPRRLPEEEGGPVGAARRRALVRCTWPRWCSSITRTRAGRRRICRSSSGPAATSSTTRRSSCTASCAISRTALLAGVMRVLIFPRGRVYSAPDDGSAAAWPRS